jgi:hypothetical protein
MGRMDFRHMHHTREDFTSLLLVQSAHKLYTAVVAAVVVVVEPRVVSR